MGARALEAASFVLPEEPGVADFMIVVDRRVQAEDWQSAFFLLAANCDAGRDMRRRGERIAFDATQKAAGGSRNDLPVRKFPELLSMDAGTRALVDRRWLEYGFTEPSPPPRSLAP
jgi:hypothetical protein